MPTGPETTLAEKRLTESSRMVIKMINNNKTPTLWPYLVFYHVVYSNELVFGVAVFLHLSRFPARIFIIIMSKALENTSWPDIAISSTGQELIAKFFSLVDKPDPNPGKSLAEEVFTEDGVLIAGPNKSVGSDGM
jgi:hypothetical protein